MPRRIILRIRRWMKNIFFYDHCNVYLNETNVFFFQITVPSKVAMLSGLLFDHKYSTLTRKTPCIDSLHREAR